MISWASRDDMSAAFGDKALLVGVGTQLIHCKAQGCMPFDLPCWLLHGYGVPLQRLLLLTA